MNSWTFLAQQGGGLQHRDSVRNCQERWLLGCLKRNQATVYLQKFGVDEHSAPEEFRRRLPLVTYEDLSAYLGRIEQGEDNVLFDGKPVAFERTSGSSGGNKLIPYSVQSLADFRAAILPWLVDVIGANRIGSGCAYWSISPATRHDEMTAAGIPVGLPDGAYLGADILPAIVDLSAVPPWVGSIQSVEDWQMATLYFLLCRNDLVLVSVWSPTFFLMLMDKLEQEHEKLGEYLRHGGNIGGQWLPPNVPASLRLAAYMNSRDARVLWPELKLVSCWADASSAPFIKALCQRLPHAKFQGKGLLATEGVITVPASSGIPVLAADSGFFEFLDEREMPRFAWELESGAQYETVMTTSGGLYRYRTGDMVRCEGSADGLPILRFLGRQNLVSDLVGEKLSEQFVATCLQGIPGFRMLVPHLQGKPKYLLILDQRGGMAGEDIVAGVEECLAKNSQYRYARRIGQLDSLEVVAVADPLATYMKQLLLKGARLGDIKVPSLRPETGWLKIFQGDVQ